MEIFFSGIMSSLITVFAMVFLNLQNTKNNVRNRLVENLNKILLISIEYPYLESNKFTDEWPKRKEIEDDEVLRYDLYCTLVFNYLSELCEFHKFKIEKVQAEIDIRSWVRQHKNYWKNPLVPYDNVEGYDKKFQKFINSYLETSK